MASGVPGGRWLCSAFLALVAIPADRASAGSSSGPHGPGTSFRGAVDPSTRFLLGQALDGAAARLDTPACQSVFSDFSDGSGHRLDRVLEESGYPGHVYIRFVFFADGAAHPLCRTDLVGAFTVPGSRVVHVCPIAVRRLARQNPELLELLLIHELLHTLGLHENPPTTEEIDARVESRCFGSRPTGVAGR